MPELPEVETIKRDLAKRLIGQTISKITVCDSRVIRNSSPTAFVRNLTQKTIKDISRRGKAIIFSFTQPGYFIVQPMMTGQLIYREHTVSAKRPTPISLKDLNLGPVKIIFNLCNQHCLTYNDQRIFGRLQFCQNLEDIKFLQTLGPEPFSKDFNLVWLKDRLGGRKSPIKSLLMDQSFVAGIGNIYASEILFRSQIHPLRKADTLVETEIVQLLEMTRIILTEAIRFRGSSVNNYRDTNGQKGKYMNRIKVYGRDGERCLVCRNPIERFVQGGRSTFCCAVCQK